jgi:hypothetical protein
MARENGGGNGLVRCDCTRCQRHDRAKALGFVAPYTPEQFVAISGGFVEPTRERPRWEPDTAEAALALDVAQVEYDEAKRAYGVIHVTIDDERSRAHRIEDELRRSVRLRELQSAEHDARTDFEDAEEQLREATIRHTQLVLRDSRAHSAASLRADQERHEREQAERAEARRTSRKSGLSLLRGR